MKPTVYIETTIVSYLTSRRSRIPLIAGQQKVTIEWWDQDRLGYDVFTSELVWTEAAAGDPKLAAARLAKLQRLPLLRIDQISKGLAAALLQAAALPGVAADDALHLAIAACNGMDYLLTWNCRHLANATLRARIEQVCRDHGYEPPIICTPLELREVRP